jgi:hypothetical protein
MDLAAIFQEIIDKLDSRGNSGGDDDYNDDYNNKKTHLKKLWNIRLANQIADFAHFEEVYRAVERAFRVADLLDAQVLLLSHLLRLPAFLTDLIKNIVDALRYRHIKMSQNWTVTNRRMDRYPRNETSSLKRIHHQT